MIEIWVDIRVSLGAGCRIHTGPRPLALTVRQLEHHNFLSSSYRAAAIKLGRITREAHVLPRLVRK